MKLALVLRNNASVRNTHSDITMTDVIVVDADVLPIEFSMQVIPNRLLIEDSEFEYLLILKSYNFGTPEMPFYKLNLEDIVIEDEFPNGISLNGEITMRNRHNEDLKINSQITNNLIKILDVDVPSGDTITISIPVKFNMKEFKKSLL
ncbi:MAG: hypothetical protein ATN31_10500 [Candidatus Epulonipiscioides saccharophilum]|nr:MAG: hypothetical protein ATN31_10500 [Epulopiscium sp. AS2M-Bin001]